VAIVATVLVGVKLLRRPRVKRGRRSWGGVVRRLCHGLTFLPGVGLALNALLSSTPTTQTPNAPAIENVSAPVFAHPGPTKTKPGSPRANHAQAIRTALSVPPVAHSMPVRLVLMPVVLRHVIHAQVVRTALSVPPVAHSMPPVVQPVPMSVVLRHVIHAQAIRTALPVPPVAHSMPPVVQPVPTPVVLRPCVIRVLLGNTIT